MDDITKNRAETPEQGSKGKLKVRGSRKKYYIWGFIIFFLIAGITGVNFAQKMKKMRDGGHLMFMINKVTKDMTLTEQQKADIEKIKQEIKAKRQSMKKDRDSKMDDFANAFKQDKLDKETLKSLEQKSEANRQEMKDFMMDELVKFHDVLTPDQRNQAVEKMKEMREKMKERFKNKKDRKFDYPPPEKN